MSISSVLHWCFGTQRHHMGLDHGNGESGDGQRHSRGQSLRADRRTSPDRCRPLHRTTAGLFRISLQVQLADQLPGIAVCGNHHRRQIDIRPQPDIGAFDSRGQFPGTDPDWSIQRAPPQDDDVERHAAAAGHVQGGCSIDSRNGDQVICGVLPPDQEPIGRQPICGWAFECGVDLHPPAAQSTTEMTRLPVTSARDTLLV